MSAALAQWRAHNRHDPIERLVARYRLRVELGRLAEELLFAAAISTLTALAVWAVLT